MKIFRKINDEPHEFELTRSECLSAHKEMVLLVLKDMLRKQINLSDDDLDIYAKHAYTLLTNNALLSRDAAVSASIRAYRDNSLEIDGGKERPRYSDAEVAKIRSWLNEVGYTTVSDDEIQNWNEYRTGQLLEIARCDLGEKADSMLIYDEWQHLQCLLDHEIPLALSRKIVSMLYDNDVDVMDLASSKGAVEVTEAKIF